MSRSTRMRRPVIAAIAAASVTVAAAVGAGVSYALWSSSQELTATIPTARVDFAVGPAGGDLVHASGSTDSVAYGFGGADAQTLFDTGTLAVPIEVQALSQGNRGLRYDVTMPPRGDGTIFGSLTVDFFPVASASDCSATTSVPADQPRSMVAVPAAYSADTTPVTQYWCLFVERTALPDEGLHSNTATATADSVGGSVSDTTKWYGNVTTALKPADEPDHDITFTFTTFRAGGS